MPRSALALLSALLLLGLAACASELDQPAEITPATRGALDVLPAGARLVAMADLEALERRGLGPHADGTLDRFSGEAGARLRRLLDATGFDPREDLRAAYVALPEGGAPSLAVYADVSADRLARHMSGEAGEAFAASSYRGVIVYERAEDEHAGAFALVGGNLVLASPEAAEVRAMIDRLSGSGTPALASDAAAMRLVERVQGGGGDAWFVARGGAGRFLSARASGENGPAARLSRAVRDAAATLHVAENGGLSGQAYLTAEEGIAAGDLAAVVRGVVASGRASAAGDREALQTLDNVQVEERGEGVRIDFAFSQPAGSQR